MFLSVAPFIEMLIIAIMLNYLLSFFWNTRSKDLVIGLLAFMLILAASSWLKLPILHQILITVSNILLIAIIIIFQPELRAALSKLSLKGRRFKEFSEFDRFLDQLANSVYRLAEKRVGALIVLEHEDVLDDYATKAVVLNSNFTPELLESIFAATTPLHDGAVILRQQTILAASVILPLAEESSQLAYTMGTRHRAALGLSQQTDALIIVISEETGKVSIAREGVMTRGIKIDRFKAIIRSIFTPPQESEFKGQFRLWEWLKK
ncbi:MAG: TIGR00159 family protein [Verrucomicrobia bacterium]|nr:TIGR00159 family protein [Verrucomicrobiota bacterium]